MKKDYNIPDVLPLRQITNRNRFEHDLKKEKRFLREKEKDYSAGVEFKYDPEFNLLFMVDMTSPDYDDYVM